MKVAFQGSIGNYLGTLKEASWVILSQFITLAGGMVLLSVVTKNVSIETFGSYALLLTVSSGVAQVLFGGINAATGRYYAIAEKESTIPEYLYAVKHLVVTVGLAVCVIAVPILVLAKNLGYLDTLTPSILILFFALLSTFRSNLSRIQNAARLRSKVALYSSFEVILKLAVALLLLSLYKGSLESLILALCISVATVSFFQYLSVANLTRRKSFSDFSVTEAKKRVAEMRRFAQPYLGWTFMVWVHQSSARWALEAFSDTEAVGGFMAVYQLCYSPMAAGFAAISTYLAPIMYQRIEATDRVSNSGFFENLTLNKKSTYLISFISLLLICISLELFSSLVHEIYFRLLVPTEYAIYSQFMGVMLIAGFFSGLSEISLLHFQGEMRVIAIRNIRIISSVFGLAGNAIGAWLYGVQGVLISILVWSLFNLLLFLAAKEPK